MKLPYMIGFALSVATMQLFAAADTMTEDDKLSYSFGYTVGKSLKNQAIQPSSMKLFNQGLDEGITASGSALLAENEVQKIMMNYQSQQKAKMVAAQNEIAKKNADEGKKFLDENTKKEGVVVSAKSGLQYKIVKPGTGKSPKATDKVTVHYRGTLIDGTEFDSSYSRGAPATFAVNGVIKGWTEALQMMKEGAKWQLFIPSNLAYGERGAGGKIGPNATLIFDVELISIGEPKGKPEK